MSHDTHEGHHHSPANDKPTVAFRAAFYFVLILAGLFVAAMGFVKSMSHEEGGHEAHAQHTEATHEGHETAAPASSEEHATAPEHATEEHHEAAPAEHH